MKRTRFTRFGACLLALLLLSALSLCACEEEAAGGAPSGDSSLPAGNSDAVSTDSTNVAPEIVDLGGREINIFSWDFGSQSIQGYTGEVIYSEEDDSSQVDVAKKAVIDHVETDYNCKISGVLDNSINLITTVANMVSSSTFDYDVVFISAVSMAAMVEQQTLTDLNTVSTLHFENSWWDQNAVEQLSIDHRLFFINGDINTYDDLGTFVVMFNKSLKERLGIEEDFYQTVRDGNWTLDHFMEICKGITKDVTGDGTIDEHDQWALGTETYNVFVQVLGGGLRVTDKDDDDLPYLTIENSPQQLYNALDKIITFYNSDDVMVANGGKYPQYPNPWEETVNKAFLEQRELFYMGGLFNLVGFRDMEDAIGVLPIPKTFADQSSYYHTVSTGNTSYLAIPRNLPNVEEVGTVLEALSMWSQQLVTPAFYDKQLKYRDVRDNESGEMLDLIFSTRSFDVCPAYDWGGITTAFTTLDSNYASRFEGLLEKTHMEIEDTIDAVQNYGSGA